MQSPRTLTVLFHNITPAMLHTEAFIVKGQQQEVLLSRCGA